MEQRTIEEIYQKWEDPYDKNWSGEEPAFFMGAEMFMEFLIKNLSSGGE